VRHLYINQADRVDIEMHGRIANEVMSYDLMDNPKYNPIQGILEVLNEHFGEKYSKTPRGKTFMSS
jgi:hypothetical protein